MNAVVPPKRCDWSTVVAQHEGPLLRYAARIVGDPDRARDIVQDTFLRLYESGGDLEGTRLRRWLFTVCRNRAIDLRRGESRFRTLEGTTEASTVPRGEQACAVAEVFEQIEAELPHKKAEVVCLRLRGGFTYAEISEQTGLTVGHVGLILHSSIKQLRTRWVVAGALALLALVIGSASLEREQPLRVEHWEAPLNVPISAAPVGPGASEDENAERGLGAEVGADPAPPASSGDASSPAPPEDAPPQNASPRGVADGTPKTPASSSSWTPPTRPPPPPRRLPTLEHSDAWAD